MSCYVSNYCIIYHVVARRHPVCVHTRVEFRLFEIFLLKNGDISRHTHVYLQDRYYILCMWLV